MATKLQAINEMVESLGEPPFTALDTGSATTAGDAEGILDRISERIQAERYWHFNTDDEEEFTVDGSDQVVLSSIIRIELHPRSNTLHVSIRGDLLWNSKTQTNLFPDETTIVLLTWRLVTFTDLPLLVATYIIKAAAIRFQRYRKRGRVDDAITRQEMIQARTEAIKENTRLLGNRVNVLDNIHTEAVHGYRRLRPAGTSPI